MPVLILLWILSACRAQLPRVSAESAPRIGSFRSDAQAITEGETLTLFAEYSAGASARLLPDDIPIESGVAVELSPQLEEGDVFETRTYTLEVKGNSAVRESLSVVIHAAPQPAELTTLPYVQAGAAAVAASVDQQAGMKVQWNVEGNGTLRSSASASSILFDVGDDFSEVVLSIEVSNAIGRAVRSELRLPVYGARVLYGSAVPEAGTVAAASNLPLEDLRFATPAGLTRDAQARLWIFSSGDYALYRIADGVADRVMGNDRNGCDDGDVSVASLGTTVAVTSVGDDVFAAFFGGSMRRLRHGVWTTLMRSTSSSCADLPDDREIDGNYEDIATAGELGVCVFLPGGTGMSRIRCVDADGVPTASASFVVETFQGRIAFASQGQPDFVHVGTPDKGLWRSPFAEGADAVRVIAYGAAVVDGDEDKATVGKIADMEIDADGLWILEDMPPRLRRLRDGKIATLAGPPSLLSPPAIDIGLSFADAKHLLRVDDETFLISFLVPPVIVELKVPSSVL